MIHPRRIFLRAFSLGLGLAALRAVVRPVSVSARATVSRSGSIVIVSNGHLTLRYDLARGLADYGWGERTVIRNGYSSAVLSDAPGHTVYSFNAGERTVEEAVFTDAAGKGIVLRVATVLRDADVTLVQQFFVYDNERFLTQRLSLFRRSQDGTPVSTNQMEVLAASAASSPPGSVSIQPAADARFYQAPFYNNDDFAVLPAQEARGALSYWLGGVIDAAGGHGLIAGAVETQRWKSAVWFDGPSGALSVHSGTMASIDTVTPAPVRGDWVDSALTFIGYRDNHQMALTDLMHVLRAMEPSLPPPPMVPPVGWSAWYEHGLETDEATVRGVTDFIAQHWAPLGYAYINLDAGWNRADGDTRYDQSKFPGGIEPMVRYIHHHGLLAGGYFVPFAINPSLLDQQVPGTEHRFREMVVRDTNGQPIRASILDWEYVLDTTHPAAASFLYWSAMRLASYGFDFIKLDFLQIGAQEGVRFDRNVTAMEAFHRGMRAITNAWRDNGRAMFISAAISPLYIQPYVHARRVGNDVEFGQARQAKNVALSWFTGLLYHRNDPDNAVVRGDWFPGYSDDLAKLHATMAAIGGTLFLAGDDPRTLSPARASLMTNASVLALARKPFVVRPLSVQQTPAPVWHGGQQDGSHIVAVFNWDGATGARHTIRFRDLGLDERAVYTLVDLWAEAPFGVFESSFTVNLAPHGVALLWITRRG
ncbi:MAG: alpha-galactosidase [Dehalococcoidia bacterium]